MVIEVVGATGFFDKEIALSFSLVAQQQAAVAVAVAVRCSGTYMPTSTHVAGVSCLALLLSGLVSAAAYVMRPMIHVGLPYTKHQHGRIIRLW